MIVLFTALVALAVGALAMGVMSWREGKWGRVAADRLRAAGERRGEAGVRVERDDRFSTAAWLHRALGNFDVGTHTALLLHQAGMSMRPGVLVTSMALCGLLGYAAALVLFHRLFPGLVFLFLCGLAPYVYVRVRKARRMQAFAREFPDALDLLVSGLRAGLSFTAAMQIVAEESPEPVRSEFAITVEEQALGVDPREALVNLTKRVDVLDLRFFVTSVLLQRETGGNLAEVLANSASLIRDRFRVLGDIATFTAQGKMTAVVLLALPLGVGLFTFIVAPDYLRPMFETPGGQKALWIAGVMQVIGMLAIRKIVLIKV